MLKSLVVLLSRWPLLLLHVFGCLLGWAGYWLSPSYRRKIWAHVRIAFPNNIAAQRRAAWGSVAHAGKALFELPYLWGRPSREGAARHCDIRGWELVEAAKQQGKGIIFLTPHMGSFESAAQVFSTRQKITVLYRPNRRADVQAIIEKSRRRDGVALAPTTLSGVRTLLKALKQGQAVGLLPDQVPSIGEGVQVPMFGQLAYTMTLPARLQHATGAVIILAIGYRKPWGRGFELLLSAGPTQLSQDPTHAAAEINQALEQLILQYPEQYYWGYERYKTP